MFSKHADAARAAAVRDADAAQPSRIIPLDAETHRTYHYWHAFVPGLAPGQVYAYRAHGPFAPGTRAAVRRREGAARSVRAGRRRARRLRPQAAARPGDNAAVAMKSVVADPGRYDWEGDLPLERPFAETVIYELHVRGFTRHPSSGVAPAKRGTYAGLIEKIPYLKDLGVTAVELLPVFQFDPQDCAGRRVELLGLSARLVLRAASRLQLADGAARRSSTNSATWSRRCTARASRSSSTSSSTTRRKAARTGRRCAIAAWPTTSITSSRRTNRGTPTTPAAATRSTPTSRSCAG